MSPRHAFYEAPPTARSTQGITSPPLPSAAARSADAHRRRRGKLRPMPSRGHRRPRYLYHYTSNSGFLGISKDRAFWASNTAYQNDAADYEYPLQLYKEILKSELASAADDERKLFDSARRLLCDLRYLPTYVVSFSEERDLLSQWRAYCPPGEGVSVGLRYAELAKAARRQQFELVTCLYDKRTQHKLVRQMVRSALNKYRKARAARALTYAEAYPFSGGLAVDLFKLAPRLKHGSFTEEREWRVVKSAIAGSPEVQFRPGKTFVVPYVAFSIETKTNPFPIFEVVVGPTPHSRLSIGSIRDLLWSRHQIRPAVVASTSTYRPW